MAGKRLLWTAKAEVWAAVRLTKHQKLGLRIVPGVRRQVSLVFLIIAKVVGDHTWSPLE